MPLSLSSMKTFNRAGPNTEPWGVPLVTACQVDETPFTTILWAFPKSILAGRHPPFPYLCWALKIVCSIMALKSGWQACSNLDPPSYSCYKCASHLLISSPLELAWLVRIAGK